MSELALPLSISVENLLGLRTSTVAALYPDTRIVVKFLPDAQEGRQSHRSNHEAHERLGASARRPITVLTYAGPSIDGASILLEYAETRRIINTLRGGTPRRMNCRPRMSFSTGHNKR
jgi:hypothetical protein